MSRDAKVTETWADDVYEFRLGVGQWIELEEKCNAGPFEIARRFTDGTFRFADVSNIIRLGLIGAGMPAVQALKLINRYVDNVPLMENVPTAQSIINAGVWGAPEEDAASKKNESPKAAANASTVSQTANGDGLKSTVLVQ